MKKTPFAYLKNTLYLILLWSPCSIIVLVFYGFCLALIKGDFERNDIIGIMATVGGIFVFVVVMSIVVGRRIHRSLKHPTPDRLLRAFSTIERLPHGRYMAAGQYAIVVALYGDLGRARGYLIGLDTGKLPPMVSAQISIAKALIAYIKGDFDRGIEFAEQSCNNADIPSVIPGAGLSKLSYATYRNLGLVLAARETDDTLYELERAFRKTPLMVKIIAAWALAIAYHRLLDSERSEKMRCFLRKSAPHLKPVHQSINEQAAVRGASLIDRTT